PTPTLPLSLHDALPIYQRTHSPFVPASAREGGIPDFLGEHRDRGGEQQVEVDVRGGGDEWIRVDRGPGVDLQVWLALADVPGSAERASDNAPERVHLRGRSDDGGVAAPAAADLAHEQAEGGFGHGDGDDVASDPTHPGDVPLLVDDAQEEVAQIRVVPHRVHVLGHECGFDPVGTAESVDLV